MPLPTPLTISLTEPQHPVPFNRERTLKNDGEGAKPADGDKLSAAFLHMPPAIAGI